MDIKKFYGVGKVTATKMYNLGIFNGKNLKEKSVEFLTKKFGKSGGHYYNIVRGIHNAKVNPNHTPKSVAAEHTFPINLTSEVYMMERLDIIADELERRLKKSKLA